MGEGKKHDENILCKKILFNKKLSKNVKLLEPYIKTIQRIPIAFLVASTEGFVGF